jgi:hypothetical protein
MKAFWDLHGARPDNDAEALRPAFRKAAKTIHPGLDAGDLYAAMRFRQIAKPMKSFAMPNTGQLMTACCGSNVRGFAAP